MMCCCRGGSSAMAVGILICAGLASLLRPLRHNPHPHLVRPFPSSKSMYPFSHFLLTSAQIPPLLLRFRPLSTFTRPSRPVDHPYSLIPCIASGVVRLRFLQINAIILSLRGLLPATDGTDHAVYYFSFPQFSLSRKVRMSSHVAHRPILARNFLPRRIAILWTLVGRATRREKLIYCFIREVRNHLAWRAVYHHHTPSSMSRPRIHSCRYSRT